MVAKTKTVAKEVAYLQRQLHRRFFFNPGVHGMLSLATGWLAVPLFGARGCRLVGGVFGLPSIGLLWRQFGCMGNVISVNPFNPPKN